MIEIRPLNKSELLKLIDEAQDSETRNLKQIIKEPFEFFQRKAVRQSGIIINGKPIYFGAITQRRNKYFLWTVVNKNVREQFTLYKVSKRTILKWVKQLGIIYAKMEKNIKHTNWVKKMGFKVLEETDNLITFYLKLEGA